MSEWIKATDRLPESDTAVLVFPGTDGEMEVAAWSDTEQEPLGVAQAAESAQRYPLDALTGAARGCVYVKISQVIAALQRIQKEHGDLNCAEEAPLGFLAIRYLEAKVVPQSQR